MLGLRATYAVLILLLAILAVLTRAVRIPAAEEAAEPENVESSKEFGENAKPVPSGERLQSEGETIEIPLTEIWAYRMPGTKDVLKLEPEVYGDVARKLSSEEVSRRLHKSLIQEIRQGLQDNPLRHLRKPTPTHDYIGFAVAGTDKDALKEVHRVLARDSVPQSSFPKDGEISLCFYSRQAGSYVHLTSIQQSGNEIEIHFQFASHFTSEMSEHFTLIPVESLKPGRVSVKVIQDPNKKQTEIWHAPAVNKEWEKQLVSGDFEFTIE